MVRWRHVLLDIDKEVFLCDLEERDMNGDRRVRTGAITLEGSVGRGVGPSANAGLGYHGWLL